MDSTIAASSVKLCRTNSGLNQVHSRWVVIQHVPVVTTSSNIYYILKHLIQIHTGFQEQVGVKHLAKG